MDGRRDQPKGVAGGVIEGVLGDDEGGSNEGSEIGKCEPADVKWGLGIESDRLQQVQLVRPDNSFRAVARAQLAVGICDVTLDGGRADD